MTEMVRGLEPTVDFIASDGTDFVRTDLGFDGGITGVMKIAHVAEGFGLDVEIHGSGPAHRHCMARIRNTNYYEMGLLHPKIEPMRPPVCADGYRDAIDAVDSNGCVQPPDGPGLGVTYDWAYTKEHETGVAVWG
jgi:L-alanine-DL-glutamate epimerase-like enolase superfamily enzyme